MLTKRPPSVDSGLYGTVVSDAALLTSHSIELTGLAASTPYHYQVTSVDATGNPASSADLTFTTDPPTLVSIAVTPANPSVVVGATQQFTATGTYSDASTADLTGDVTWASSPTAVATITAGGLATGVAEGTTTISATLGAVVGSTTLTVPATPSEAKFFTVDSDVFDRFEYDGVGALLSIAALATANIDPMGTTASYDGSTVWVVDKNKGVYVYDEAGVLQGSWSASGQNRPSGIATEGTDILIVDEKNKRVYRYGDAAAWVSGDPDPVLTGSFPLHGANTKAKGITTDGSSIWVVNDCKTPRFPT